MGTSHAFRFHYANVVMLMDTVDDDGIETMVVLEKECMDGMCYGRQVGREKGRSRPGGALPPLHLGVIGA
ncbi:hypothetical protein R6Q57_019281 [Mikania cordata]